jgi:YggT family protein
MQWVRADYRNPIVQFILKITNPLVMPLHKFIPSIYKIDTATLTVYMLLCWAGISILTLLECATTPDIFTTLILGVIFSIRVLLNTYTFVILGFVILSWIGQGGYNPSIAMMSQVLGQLAQPILRPVQRIIPPIAGLDLTPIFVLIFAQAIARMLIGPAYQAAQGYNCLLIGII